jgi:anti-sigma regulatory factor (Ser/Thr protein kinase)
VTYQQRSFVPVVASVGEARRFVTDALHLVGCTEAVTTWARLVTSELATNAVVHARSDFEVGVGTNGQVVISVSDRASQEPVVTHAGPAAPGGRGMLLVAGTSDAWGVEPQGSGKRVWCSSANPDAA